MSSPLDLFPEESLEMSFLQLGAMRWSENGYVHEKTVPFSIIAQVTRGSYDIQCQGQRRLIEPGEAFFTPPHVPMRITHLLDSQGRGASRYVHFGFTLFHSIDVVTLLRPPLRLQGAWAGQTGRIIGQLLQNEKTSGKSSLFHAVYKRELAWRILRIICECSPLQPWAQEFLAGTHRLLPLMTHLCKHPSDVITAGQMARMTHLSPSRFHQLFRQQFSCSAMEYVKRLRLDQAGYRLVSTDQTIAQIADAVGFANPFHLSREFKKRFGQSPILYRKMLTKTNTLR